MQKYLHYLEDNKKEDWNTFINYRWINVSDGQYNIELNTTDYTGNNLTPFLKT